MSEFGAAQLPKAGDVIGGKYTVERIIGQGGMGAVFAARHVKLGHAVAIKVMLADRQNEEAARRFMNEGRASAHIQNDHVVRIFDIDEERGYAYMVLELLQGEDLAQVLEQLGRLMPHVAVGYVLQALEGVRQAHSLGIVHRDLKPSNLFLAQRQDGSVVVKVLDFGISKAGSTSALDMAPHQKTSTAAMLGSPLYMSPEQLRSSKNVDARADIWAIGVILYELLTGVVPFEGETLGALFAAILETDAPHVRATIPEVPPGLDAIITRCLQRRPDDRFSSVAELERELAPFATASSAPRGSPLALSALAPPSHVSPSSGSMSAGRQTGPAAGAMPGGARVGADTSGLLAGLSGVQRAPMVSGPMMGAPAGYPGAGGTPDYARMAPASGSGPQVPHGTVPLGAVTPQPHRQTGNTWQSTGSRTKPKSSAGVLVVVVGVLLLLGGVGIAGIVSWKASHASAQAAASGSSSSGAVPSAVVSAPVVASAAASSTPTIITMTPVSATVGTTPSAPPSAATTARVAGIAPSRHAPPTSPATAKIEPPSVPDPPKVEPPKTVAPPVHPPPAPTAGTLQGNR